MNNFFGLNPTYKDFLEKHPDSTMLGLAWAMYWRLMVLVLAIEMAFLVAILVVSISLAILFH